MAKPKLKGATVGVQLPLAVDRALRAQAQALGTSPGLLAAQLVTQQLGMVLQAPVSSAQPVVRPSLPAGNLNSDPAGCRHRYARKIGNGMADCDDCGMRKGANGQWFTPVRTNAPPT